MKKGPKQPDVPPQHPGTQFLEPASCAGHTGGRFHPPRLKPQWEIRCRNWRDRLTAGGCGAPEPRRGEVIVHKFAAYVLKNTSVFFSLRPIVSGSYASNCFACSDYKGRLWKGEGEKKGWLLNWEQWEFTAKAGGKLLFDLLISTIKTILWCL